MKKIPGILFLLSLVCSLGLTSEAYAFFEDFQSAVPGSRPDNAVYTTAGVIEVVGGTDDPFGISGNQSLRLWQTSITARIAYTSVSAGYPSLTAGIISFDYYVADVGTGAKKTNIYFTEGTTVGAANDAFRILIDDVSTTGRIRLSNGGTHPDVTNYSIQFDTAYSFQILFQDSQYEVFVKEYGESDYTKLAIGAISTFSYFSTGKEISTVQFTSGASGAYRPFYVDNISIIPEPHVYGMISASGLALLILGVRKRKQAA